MSALSKQKQQFPELLDLAFLLADDDAPIILNSNCLSDGPWHNTRDISSELKALVDRAVRYLDLRGMLKRHPKKPHLVKVMVSE